MKKTFYFSILLIVLLLCSSCIVNIKETPKEKPTTRVRFIRCKILDIDYANKTLGVISVLEDEKFWPNKVVLSCEKTDEHKISQRNFLYENNNQERYPMTFDELNIGDIIGVTINIEEFKTNPMGILQLERLNDLKDSK